MDDADGAVRLGHGAQQRQRDGVVAAERDDARQRPALAPAAAVDAVVAGRGRPLEAVLQPRVRLGRAREHGVVPALDLLDGVGVVVAGDGDVAAVDDGGPACEGVGRQGHVVPAFSFSGRSDSFRASYHCLGQLSAQEKGGHLLEIQPAGALPNARGAKASTGSVRRA